MVTDADTQRVVDIIISQSRTGETGDGKIFIIPVANAIWLHTGESGDSAL